MLVIVRSEEKRCNKSLLFFILKKGVKKDKHREEVVSSMKHRKQE
jgi:hypothetical protein